MAKVKGVDILIYANTGTEAIPVWTVVGGQRGATLSEKAEPIDVTAKDSGGYQEFEYGLASWTISADGVYVESEAGYAALVNAMRQKQKIKVRWNEGGTDTYEGLALVTSRDLEGPYDGEATYSLELQGSGVPTLGLEVSAGLTALTGVDSALGALDFIPDFANDTYLYTIAVATGITYVKLTPTAAGHVITITANNQTQTVASGSESGQIALGAAGSVTPILITAQEPGKSPKKYNIFVTRAAV